MLLADHPGDFTPPSDLGALGIGVKVKVPKEIRQAAKSLPEATRVGDRFASVLDASNTTFQAVAVAGVFGAIIYALIRNSK